ncbi:Glucoamylase (glucan-1,4-alpha-glucosidase), GH15 family [Nitrosospira sp. Nsp14]|uniref:glycoside hydrolase family 15 protein n=1 Tax=Nitrosospira sp. Nsp14 TaxID=1855333 RepID=UPI0008EC53A4|nr:glycoside hydrolase family 15 protein [Nitrosospira sp. Nsp14]SFH44992.1 Glucoamylase (glucan-1,4-alpha-glucosidase), GH15 family [Nitrosospira sp. Nsp14]
MSKPIEDYGFIGNMLSGALVAQDGSMDWLCLPRFDSDACFAALLGTREHGYWRISPVSEVAQPRRRYLPHTPILETTFETEDGTVTLADFMPLSDDPEKVDVIRLVRGVSGRVSMRMDFVLRFGYGRTIPWVRRRDYGIHAVAGPDAVELVTRVPLYSKDMRTTAEFEVREGEVVPFTLAYHPLHREPHFVGDTQMRLEHTADWWRDWVRICQLSDFESPVWKDAVERSLITLKALSYQPSGAIVAAPTTSLPEERGGFRNWDYRYCWIRDATLTLYAFMNAGYFDEAGAFRKWLLRAAAGAPGQMQIMYGVGGERRLTEIELPWLPGYENSRPVRIGNGAYDQIQIDVFGELMDALHTARKSQLGPNQDAWWFQQTMLSRLEGLWREPDKGIWEVRGGSKHFVHSKVMAWVAFDRAVKAVEQSGLPGPAARWRAIRDEIHQEVMARGYDRSRNTFVQHYEGAALDASLLLMAEVGFLPPEDRRFRGTVEAIERELVEDGLVLRYRPEETEDGLPGEEGTFLVCSFWLADAYTMIGRPHDAEALFEYLLSLRNDLGLLAEEYHPRLQRQLGNCPQAFSHIGLINTAYNLRRVSGPAQQRADLRDCPRADRPAAREASVE